MACKPNLQAAEGSGERHSKHHLDEAERASRSAINYPIFLMKAPCFALLASSPNLQVGYVAPLSFGHATFFGCDGYLLLNFDASGLPDIASAGAIRPGIKRLSQKASPPGVSVNRIAPGATATSMLEGKHVDIARIHGAMIDVNGGSYFSQCYPPTQSPCWSGHELRLIACSKYSRSTA